MSEKPECLVCEENINESTPIVLNDLALCRDCFESNVKPQFAQALIDESSYPVRWSGQDVAIDPVRQHFDDDFLAKWALMQAERRILPKNRHYCAGSQCGHWDLGKPCPRYNHPEDPNALYDHGVPHAEDDLDGPQPMYHPAWNPDGDPEVPELFEGVVQDEFDAVAAALDPPLNEETLEEQFEQAIDVAYFSREMTLVLQDVHEIDRVLDELQHHARDNYGMRVRPPRELRNFHHLLHLLWSGVYVYAAPLLHALGRPLGAEWKEMFIRSYDEQVDTFYRDTEQERARWPTIDAIYDRYKLAVADRLEELMAQAPPEE